MAYVGIPNHHKTITQEQSYGILNLLNFAECAFIRAKFCPFLCLTLVYIDMVHPSTPCFKIQENISLLREREEERGREIDGGFEMACSLSMSCLRVP
jgi:hypothetical protein